jgi:hypothetical protein
VKLKVTIRKQTNKNKKNEINKNKNKHQDKKTNNNPKAELDRCCERFRHCAQWPNHV